MDSASSLAIENQQLREKLSQQALLLEDKNHLLENKTRLLEKKGRQVEQAGILLEQRQQHIRQLEEMLRSLTHRQYGTSSEKNPDQKTLFNEAEAELEPQDEGAPEASEADTITVPSHQRKKTRRVSIPDWIEREEIVYDLPESEKTCPHDGAALTCIGEEVHEQLDIIPAQIKALRHIRKKYACPCCDGYLKTASKPKQPIEKGIASPGLLAHIVLNKYADALPLYRQTAIFKRLGIELDRTSMANWMIRCGELAQPLINLLHDKLVEQSVIHMDETPVQVLNEPGKTAQSQSYMWVIASSAADSPAVLFNYAASRSQQTPNQLLEGYSGALMVDGYEGYKAISDTPAVQRLGCWAHARRKFVEAQRAQPKKKQGRVDVALAKIQQLYAIEKRIKEEPPDKRYVIRQAQAKPIIHSLRQWLDKSLVQVAPKTAMGKALSYLDNQWDRLVGYLDDGRYPIDNNRAENAIRPFVIGRKNWLFSNSQAGAKASANLYSLIETAKANELNLYDYFKAIFTRLPNAKTVEDIEALLPWSYK